jgi:hypothetical protein
LKRTLHSFYKNCFSHVIEQCRLIINVDPIGEDVDTHEMLEVVSGYFKNFQINFPGTASFPVAFQWCWDKVTAPWVLNLEDDWELLSPVDIEDLVLMMELYPQLASLRIPFFPSTETSMKNWNLHFPWNGNYFECPDDLRKTAGFAGHPSLLRGKFVQNCAPLLLLNSNPEKQFHGGNGPLLDEVMRWQYGVWGRPNGARMLADIGAEWKVKNKFQKAGSKAFFINWEAAK